MLSLKRESAIVSDIIILVMKINEKIGLTVSNDYKSVVD